MNRPAKKAAANAYAAPQSAKPANSHPADVTIIATNRPAPSPTHLFNGQTPAKEEAGVTNRPNFVSFTEFRAVLTGFDGWNTGNPVIPT
jgi:hypothetical protein